MPVIPTPSHPSYPSNHSLQCHLVMHCALAGMPEDVREQMKPVLRALADRIAQNREIAGVHFGADTDAGSTLAERLFPLLEKGSTFSYVADKAKAEWVNFEYGGKPDDPYPETQFPDQVLTMIMS